MKSQNDFAQCPQCGSKQIQNVNMRKWKCPDCGFDLYNNVAAAVGLVIADSDGRVLFERRAKAPRKGFLALPGGFVDPDETAEEACVRECKEEIGAVPAALRYLCSFPNTYDYKGIRYKTCDLFFEAALAPHAQLHAQEGEVTAFERHALTTQAALDALPLAFESARKTLALWLAQRSDAGAGSTTHAPASHTAPTADESTRADSAATASAAADSDAGAGSATHAPASYAAPTADARARADSAATTERTK